jgi:hypothetical protein
LANSFSGLSQNDCIVDIISTSKITYLEVEQFWLEGDNFFLYVEINSGTKSYKKIIFNDSINYLIESSENNSNCIQLATLDGNLKLENIDLIEDTEFRFIGNNQMKYKFDFVILKIDGKINQFIPFASTFNNSYECINNNISDLIKNIIWKGLEIISIPIDR